MIHDQVQVPIIGTCTSRLLVDDYILLFIYCSALRLFLSLGLYEQSA